MLKKILKKKKRKENKSANALNTKLNKKKKKKSEKLFCNSKPCVVFKKTSRTLKKIIINDK